MSARPLVYFQLLMATVVGAISVISAPRHMLLQISDQANIPLEFRMVAISIPDYFMVVLLITTALLLSQNTLFREHFFQVNSTIWKHLGGWLWISLIAVTIASIFWSAETTLARFTALHIVACFGMTLVIAVLVVNGYDNWLLGGLIISAVLQGIVAISQVFNNGPLGLTALGEVESRFYYETENFFRARGLSMHPNYLGGYLMLALLACLLLIQRQRRQWQWVLVLSVAGLLIGAGLIATLSRSAILATGAVLSLIAVVWRRQFLTSNRRRLVWSSVVVIVLFALAWGGIALSGNWDNVQNRIFGSREFFWDDTLEIIQNDPLTGAGIGNLMIEIGRGRLLEIADLLPVHNVYLFIWGELGLIGAILFVTAFGTTLWKSFKQSPWLIWNTALLGIAVIMIFDNYWWAVQPFRVTFFWALGLAWGYALSESSFSPQNNHHSSQEDFKVQPQ